MCTGVYVYLHAYRNALISWFGERTYNQISIYPITTLWFLMELEFFREMTNWDGINPKVRQWGFFCCCLFCFCFVFTEIGGILKEHVSQLVEASANKIWDNLGTIIIKNINKL